jgi:molybdopterin-guanine dinucleotide biosynthesis protein A
MIDRVARALRTVTNSILVAGGPASTAHSIGATHVGDETPGPGPLGGIAAGLTAAAAPCVVLACDMPFVDPALLRLLVSSWRGEDAVVPRQAGRPEPLHALWSPSALAEARSALADGRRSPSELLGRLRTRWLDEPEWEPLHPEGRSWRSVNTPEDLAAARSLMGRF